MTPFAEQSIAAFAGGVAARQPAPGGGAVAAVIAGLAAALGAMACRYTTGKRYAEHHDSAITLAQHLDHLQQQCLDLADADAAAYAQVQELRAEKASASAIASAEAAAMAIPLHVLEHCAKACKDLQGFTAVCNPWLLADLRAALHLCAGAADAAWEILLCGSPPEHLRQQATQWREQCRQSSQALLSA
ncbi:MAG: hypothetical protein EA401_12590 [Planctomycetota bacterium]|nr:MAG: hypothetical protein EA401_12590 [Planctomycetota bacterium]